MSLIIEVEIGIINVKLDGWLDTYLLPAKLLVKLDLVN